MKNIIGLYNPYGLVQKAGKKSRCKKGRCKKSKKYTRKNYKKL
jgi:hypothetical protein